MAVWSARPINYTELIQDDETGFRVNGRLYTDPSLFEEEMERIFHRGWVFVGHTSEIPLPGDYRTRWIGLQPIMMSRDEDGQVHLLLNRCRHQANTVCQEERGNANYFRCAYHGWVYTNKGDLAGVPFPGGYDDSFRAGEYGLIRVPRMAIYRGFIFASLSPAGQSFEEYIGQAKDYIDRYCDLAPEGEILATAGRQKVLYHGNWKFQLTNLTDQYHVFVTHATGIRNMRRDITKVDWEDPAWKQRDLGGGHTILDWFAGNRKLAAEGALTETFTGIVGILEPSVIDAVARRLGSREKAEQLAQSGAPHIMVFPNLMLLFNAFRIIQPVSVNLTYLYYYPTFLKGASDEINERRLRAHENAFGAAGFIAPDDTDMFTRMQIGVRAKVHDWIVLNRGRHQERLEPDEFGVSALTAQILMETTHRGLWRHYRQLMLQA